MPSARFPAFHPSFGLPGGAALACLALLALACAHPRARADFAEQRADLAYELELFTQPLPAVRVTATFRGTPRGETVLGLGRRPAGDRAPRAVRAWSLENAPLPVRPAGPLSWSVQHPPGAWIRVSYVLLPAADIGSPPGDLEIEPHLSDSVFLAGEGAWLVPEHLSGPLQVSFDWRDFGQDGAIALCSLGAPGTTHTVASAASLRRTLFIAGRLQVHSNRSGVSVVVGADGPLASAGPAWSDAVEAIMLGARRVLGPRAPLPGFIVLLESPRAPSPQVVTSSFDSALAVLVPSGTEQRAAGEAAALQAIARQVLREGMAGAGAISSSMSWFVEGFARFSARRLLYRQGLMALPDVVAELNAVFESFLLNEERGARAERLEGETSSPALEALPGQRGEVLALLIDAAMRQKTQGRSSLDDFVPALWAELEQTGSGLTPWVLLDAVQRQTSPSVADEVWSVVEHGELPKIEPELLEPCLSMTLALRGPYDLGFDLETSRKTRVVRGVKFGSRAWQAGLRDGQRLLRWSIEGDEPAETVELVVFERGSARVVFYTPQGRSAMVPVFSVADASACPGIL